MLTRDETKRFYDRFGARQDEQAFYEEPALDDLVAHAAFGEARAVFELGCGTGRLAHRLLADHLPPDARYTGIDLSDTMVRLSRERLALYGERAEVLATGGEPVLPFADASFDRFVSTYVLDLLPEREIGEVLAEARRVLARGGFLCLAGLTHGTTLASKAVLGVWRAAHALRPAWVGGCRPVAVADFLSADDWSVVHRGVTVAWGIASEVIVARRQSED